MFIEIPVYKFDEDEEVFDLSKVESAAYNTEHIISIRVLKHPEYEDVWILAMETTSKEDSHVGLAFPNEEEPKKIKEQIIAATSYVRNFREAVL